MIKKIKKTFSFIKKVGFLYSIYKNIFLKKYLIEEERVFRQLKEIENYSDSELRNIQQQKILDILQYAYNNSTYYKKIFDKYKIDILNVNTLPQIPLLTKDIISKNENDIICKLFEKEYLVKRNTGGSTGQPLEFYSDRMGAYIDNAHHRYLYLLMGYENGDMVIDSGGVYIPQRLRNRNIYWIKSSEDHVCGDYDFSVLYLTDMNIHYYVKKIISIKPTIMRGYPSFFDKLATYILDKQIILPFQIKGINLTAEMCSIEQRNNIEKAFSSIVYFEYGHSEISVYCYTQDDSYIYKSSPIYGYIEVIKDDGSPAEIGEIGEIIATSFCNRGMPFIRYQTGDNAEVLKKNGGIVHFKKIYGRVQDYILSKDNQKVFLTALIFGQHFKAFKNIIEWQLVQNKIGFVTVKIIKDKNYSLNDEKEILEKLKTVTNIDIEFKYVDEIPLTKRGKHLFLIKNIGSR